MPGSEVDSTERTEQLFRPFLQTIPFHNPDSTDRDLVFSGIVNDCYSKLGKAQLHLYVIKRKPAEDGRLGHGLFTVDGDDCYIFKIYLNPVLFYGEKYDSPQLRKAVGVHEFVHCVAAAINLPKFKTKAQREEFRTRLLDKLTVDIISTKQIEEIKEKKGEDHLLHRAPLGPPQFYPNNLLFDDEHYRLQDDNSPIKYHELYDQFLLSKDAFESFFEKSELENLKKTSKQDVQSAYRLALRRKDKIAKTFYLYEDIVIRRAAEIIVSYNKE
jgi:hypothetical protein